MPRVEGLTLASRSGVRASALRRTNKREKQPTKGEKILTGDLFAGGQWVNNARPRCSVKQDATSNISNAFWPLS